MRRKYVLLGILGVILFGAQVANGARLPVVGGDSNNWGEVLNAFLNQSLGTTSERLNTTNITLAGNITFRSNQTTSVGNLSFWGDSLFMVRAFFSGNLSAGWLGSGTRVPCESVQVKTGDGCNPGGGGSSKWYTFGDFLAIDPAQTAATSITVNGTSGTVNSTRINTTFLNVRRNSTFSGRMVITASENFSTSTSVGGMINLVLTANSGAGLIIYSNQGPASAGRLLNIRSDHPNFSQSAFNVNYNGTGDAVGIIHTGTGSGSSALDVSSQNPTHSAMGLSGRELNHGTLKIEHNGSGGGDESSAALSIDLTGRGTASQGIFIDATEGGTTGDFLDIRNNGTQKIFIDHQGNLDTEGNISVDGNITATGGIASWLVGLRGLRTISNSTMFVATQGTTGQIVFQNSTGQTLASVNSSNLKFHWDVVPSSNSSFHLGLPSFWLEDGYFTDIFVSGNLSSGWITEQTRVPCESLQVKSGDGCNPGGGGSNVQSWLFNGEWFQPNATGNVNVSTGTIIAPGAVCTSGALQTTGNGTVVCDSSVDAETIDGYDSAFFLPINGSLDKNLTLTNSDAGNRFIVNGRGITTISNSNFFFLMRGTGLYSFTNSTNNNVFQVNNSHIIASANMIPFSNRTYTIGQESRWFDNIFVESANVAQNLTSGWIGMGTRIPCFLLVGADADFCNDATGGNADTLDGLDSSFFLPLNKTVDGLLTVKTTSDSDVVNFDAPSSRIRLGHIGGLPSIVSNTTSLSVSNNDSSGFYTISGTEIVIGGSGRLRISVPVRVNNRVNITDFLQVGTNANLIGRFNVSGSTGDIETRGNLVVGGLGLCTQALETTSNGTVICGTDEGGTNTASWLLSGGKYAVNNTAVSGSKLNVTTAGNIELAGNFSMNGIARQMILVNNGTHRLRMFANGSGLNEVWELCPSGECSL